ncbi:hypothetical protein Droror1_Dr00012920 [Drosera rotundifolia]
MEIQDQLRRNSSGHEGRHRVYICHKCGWPFPNPQPSPKHRRAHKRICGTIEGYKLENSKAKTTSNLDGSDDDDELKSPSPSPRGVRITAASQGSGSGSSSRSTSLDKDVIVGAVSEPGGGGTKTEYVFSDAAVKESLRVVRNLSEEIDRVPSDPPVENDSVDNLGSLVGSIGDSQQPVIVGTSSEHALAETSPIASSVLVAAREEVAVDENVTALTTSSGVDVAIEETKQATSTALGSNEKESHEAKSSAVLDTEAKDNEDVVSTRNDSQRESLAPDAALEAYEVAVPQNESGETLDVAAADVTVEITGDGLETSTDSSAVVDSVKDTDSFIESSSSVGGTVEVESAKMSQSNDKWSEEDSMRFHDLKVAEDLPSQENATRENESEELSKEVTTSASHSVDYGNPIDESVESSVTVGAELAESDNQGVSSIKDDRSSHVTERGSCSEVAGAESALTAAIHFESESNTETQADLTISPIEHGDAPLYHKTGVENTVSTELETDGAEEEGSGAADAGLSAEPALIIPKSNDEIDSGLQLEIEAEIPDEHTISLHEDADKVNECENALVVKEVNGPEEQNLGDTNEGAGLEKNHVLVPSENPSNQKDLVETQDGGEDLHKTDAKLVAEESIPPIDMSDVPNEGATTEHDLSSVSRDDANLNLAQETIGSRDDKAVGDAVNSHQRSHVEGSHTKGSAQDMSSVHDDSSQAQGGDDGVLHGAISENDVLAESSSQTDILEANQVSGSAPTDAEATVSNDSKTSETVGAKQEGAADPQQSDNSDLFDPPSFMTLVEPKAGDVLNENVSETQTVQNLELKGSPSPAGWFPSVAYVAASDSPGRKRNEEIIAKVSQSQRIALRSLLGEAYDDEKQAKPPSGKENDPLVGTKNGNLVTDAEEATDAGKEWSSLPKYLTKSKSEKGKPRSWWSPFLCCVSANSGEISQ